MSKKILKNIEKIREWIKNSHEPSILKTNDQFMSFWVQIMSYALYLLQVSSNLSRNPEKGETKHRAIVIGLMVRMSKLYEGFIKHIADRELELALIFVRLISETEVKINYLLNSPNKKKSSTSFILSSYKSEKERLIDLQGKSKRRNLIPIEKHMLKSIKETLKNDAISQKKLFTNKTWKIDGKDFKQILQFLNRELEYAYIFGGMSHFVHGTWHDLSFYHLEKRKGRYFPKSDYSIPDPRVTSSITLLVLNRLLEYLKWSKADSKKHITEIVELLLELIYRYDAHYETILNKYYLKNV